MSDEAVWSVVTRRAWRSVDCKYAGAVLRLTGLQAVGKVWPKDVRGFPNCVKPLENLRLRRSTVRVSCTERTARRVITASYARILLMDTIQPEERQAFLAQLALPPKRPRRPRAKRHSAAAAELLELSDRIFSQHPHARPSFFAPEPRPPWRHWPSCRHNTYHLSCSEYEMLEREADGFCALCHYDYRGDTLEIDHDHAIGWRAVRGLICRSCNIRLSLIDSGRREPNRDAQFYLADPWHSRVGLEDLTCPPTCERRDHLPGGASVHRPVDQRRHLAEQLWVLG
jgi:hypothetical protein